MSNNQLDTLFELLDKYHVEVPIVQRDYAQGRQDVHATTVRSTLLNDMRAAVVGETPPLDLNFVYGKARDKKFIPIDGQQRLTTLFLLHLYAFRNDETKTPILYKFTYETRISSRDFLKKLISNRADVFAAGSKPSEQIEDSEWFVLNWTNDPTIGSILIMLDAIQSVFGDIDNLAEKLTDASCEPLVFKFLEMQDLGMEDSLYIKLNARGKPLTEFESFKARLLGRMKKLGISYTEKFEVLFDCDWTDMFWAEHKEDFDQTYYSFFGILLMNKGVITEEYDWANTLDYSKISAEVFDTAFFTLNFLCNNRERKRVLKLVFNAIKWRSYYSRVLFHAVSTYLLKNKGFDNGSLESWIRIIKNLTTNSTIDTFSLYRNAINGIDDLSINCDSLLEYFSERGKVTGFNQHQVEEEQIKARLISVDAGFAHEIFQAETHSYFDGQIRSGLYISKISGGNYDMKLFTQYWKKISALFHYAKPRHGNLLRCALLALGDYTLPVSQFKTLCVDDPNEFEKTPSMKSLFSSCCNIVRQLLDMLNTDEAIQPQLERIIERSAVPKNDWRYCLIKYPNLFSRMSMSHLRIRELQGEMHLIQNKWSNGYNYAVFLSALHEELKSRNIQSKFDSDLGGAAQHCLYVDQYTLSYSAGKFSISVENKIVVFESQSDNPIPETADFFSQNNNH